MRAPVPRSAAIYILSAPSFPPLFIQQVREGGGRLTFPGCGRPKRGARWCSPSAQPGFTGSLFVFKPSSGDACSYLNQRGFSPTSAPLRNQCQKHFFFFWLHQTLDLLRQRASTHARTHAGPNLHGFRVCARSVDFKIHKSQPKRACVRARACAHAPGRASGSAQRGRAHTNHARLSV